MQGSIIIAYGNLITPLVTMTASNSEPTLPPAFTAADFRGVSCFTQAGHVSEEWIKATFSGAQTFNAFAIIDPNITDVGTVELHASTDGFVLSDDTLVPASIVASNPALFVFPQVTQYTSIKVIIKDPTNPAGFLKFGKLFLGGYVQPSANYDFGWSDGIEDRSQSVETPNNVMHFDRRAKQRVPRAGFVQVPPEDRDLMDALVEEVGHTEPFIVALDPDNTPERTRYVRFESAVPNPVEQFFEGFSYSMALREAL
jgi:hypothetical protein